MKNQKRYFFPFVFGIVLCAAIYGIGLDKIAVFAQKTALDAPLQNNQSAPEITEPPKSLITKTASVSATAFAPAAQQNARLRNSLGWSFGGKSQTGWQLYKSLIQREIETDTEPDSPEFALALSGWQKRSGLTPNGILDGETLNNFVKTWQSRRLGSSAYPSSEQLLSAPIAEFYDPTRSTDLLQLERETYTAYKKLLAAAIADKTLNLKTTKTGELAPEEKFLRIVSAFRSREYQEKLRLASPNSGRAGLARHSPHFTGRALDIYVGGEPVTTKDFNRALQVETLVYKWLVKNAHRFGFQPYFYEPWHWEYVGMGNGR